MSAAKRLRRLTRYEEVVALHGRGLSTAAIAAQVGLSRPTVRKYLQAGSFPEWAPRRTGLSPGTRHGEYLRTRWQQGIQDATVLWLDLQARGYRGSVRTVQHAVKPWRDGPALRGRQAHRLSRPPTEATWAHRPPSATQATWWLLQPVTALTPTQQRLRQRLLEAAPEVEQALAEILDFRRLIRERDAAALTPWLTTAEASPVPEVRAFAAGLRRDQAAVQAALDQAWSSGRVEGHITKIKLIKRQMYGRGSFDLLKRRVMHAS
jgi:transposase